MQTFMSLIGNIFRETPRRDNLCRCSLDQKIINFRRGIDFWRCVVFSWNFWRRQQSTRAENQAWEWPPKIKSAQTTSAGYWSHAKQACSMAHPETKRAEWQAESRAQAWLESKLDGQCRVMSTGSVLSGDFPTHFWERDGIASEY